MDNQLAQAIRENTAAYLELESQRDQLRADNEQLRQSLLSAEELIKRRQNALESLESEKKHLQSALARADSMLGELRVQHHELQVSSAIKRNEPSISKKIELLAMMAATITIKYYQSYAGETAVDAAYRIFEEIDKREIKQNPVQMRPIGPMFPENMPDL